MWGNAKGKLRTDWIEPDRVHPEGSEAWNPIVPWLQASWRANQCISGCKKHWSSNSFVVIKTCDHFMSIIMSFCGTKGGPNSQKVVWRRFFLQKCQKRRMRNWRRNLKYKSDHVPRTPLQCHMFSSCSWLCQLIHWHIHLSFVFVSCHMSQYYAIDILLRTFLSRHWLVTLCFGHLTPLSLWGMAWVRTGHLSQRREGFCIVCWVDLAMCIVKWLDTV